MSRTEQLLQQSRREEIKRASHLQLNLALVLARLSEPEYERIRKGLQELKDRHISLLDEGIAAGFITETDYRRLMADKLDEIDLSDLLSALS